MAQGLVAPTQAGQLEPDLQGSDRTASASTIPTGLSLNVTYNGSASTPVKVGSYTVMALVTSPNYTGGATNTLVVGKATATVTVGSLSQTYDGTAKSVSATTVPASLTVDCTYGGGGQLHRDGDGQQRQLYWSRPESELSAGPSLGVGTARQYLSI